MQHRLNMDIDLQSLFRLLCTAVLTGWDPATPLPPALGLIYEGAIGQPRYCRRRLFVIPGMQSAASKPSQSLRIYWRCYIFFSSPFPRRCDASNSGISQSLNRPTLQSEEECRNIKGFKHREKVIKASVMYPGKLLSRYFQPWVVIRENRRGGTGKVVFALSYLKGQ